MPILNIGVCTLSIQNPVCPSQPHSSPLIRMNSFSKSVSLFLLNKYFHLYHNVFLENYTFYDKIQIFHTWVPLPLVLPFLWIWNPSYQTKCLQDFFNRLYFWHPLLVCLFWCDCCSCGFFYPEYSFNLFTWQSWIFEVQVTKLFF